MDQPRHIFASDSRITWLDGSAWDRGRKLFASRRRPHILGYCGDVLFPVQTLGQITEMIDANLIADGQDCIEECFDRVVSITKAALESYPLAAKRRFDLLYCIREGESVPSRFHLRQITFVPDAPPLITSITMPSRSEPVAILGSGAAAVSARINKWAASDVGGTSRAVFSAFCDSLRLGDDVRSGGPPQVVGMWRKASPQTFGMIWDRRRYFYGTEVEGTARLNELRWYNELFEICDPYTLARKVDAQPQPRPRGLLHL
jgi:hypothetical protein